MSKSRLITLGPHRAVTMDAIEQGGRTVNRAATPDPALARDAITWFRGANRMLETAKQRRIK